MNNEHPTGWPGEPIEPPGLGEIEAAAQRLQGTIVRTPLVRLRDQTADPRILLKPETLQPIGSFKVRGVGNWALGLDQTEVAKGLSTTSAGNTAQALGYMAQQLGVSSRSMVPDNLHAAKRAAIEAYGTELIGVSMTDLMLYMFDELWAAEPYCYLNPWGEPDMISGHGTIGLEVYEDLPTIDSVFVPVGGGALVSGVGAALKAVKPDVKVFAVQAEVNSALQAAFSAGGATWIEYHETIVEGASTPVITHNMYPMIRSLVDELIVVSEEETKAAMRRLAISDKLVTEGAGAASVAAALKVPLDHRGESVCIVSGGSVDPAVFASVLS